MEQLKVGIIGTGMAFERLHYPAYQELNANYQIVALCDEDRSKALNWANKLAIPEADVYSDFRELAKRDDLQVIDIMVPIAQNFTMTEAVAALVGKTKKAIICEKPLAPTLEQAEKCAGLPRKYDVAMMIAENYRYNEDPNIIRDLVGQGHIGEADYFVWNRVLNFPDDMKKDAFPAREWRQHPNYPGGVFYDTAVHDMAALRHIFGPIDELMAYGQKEKAALDQWAVVNVVFRFMSGFTGSYNFYAAGKEMQRPLIGLRIIGQKGEIYQEERDCGTINLTNYDGSSKQLAYQPQRGYYNELLNFYNAYTGKEAITVTPELELGDAKTLLAIIESLEQETPVKVDEAEAYTPYYATGQKMGYEDKRM
ncbi:MAG TPA: oxidoreductase [Firmicutes bacterium]|jgi:predicted dehydrogenase|nr:oxidoreductase [Bacillota bacterium]